ncbi:MAG: hypothetical protein JXO51_07550 [Candidatus Aminicenantes bacterium]|nr:hypothetical protein [Candidatus Aminicenantes bacterium]
MKRVCPCFLPLFAVLALLAPPAAADTVPKIQIKKPMVLMAPDLTGVIRCPTTALAGQELKSTITVWAENRGNGTSGAFSVDLVLSRNEEVPVEPAVYSANYHDDVLLQGGRERVSGLPAATLSGPARKKVKLNGSNRIPADTPPGNYYLAAVIDSGREIGEKKEDNNVALCRIRVVPGDLPDLRVTGFAHTGSPAGSPPECRLLVTIVNFGPAPIPLGSGARLDVYVNDVLVESVDIDSAKVEQTAYHDVHNAYDSANPGKSRSVVGLDYIFPSSAASVTYSCRAVVDAGNAITELNETNNGFSRDEVIPAH